MAGNGPAPKPEGLRAGHRKTPGSRGASVHVLPVKTTPQPELPDFDVTVSEEGELVAGHYDWPTWTREWWKAWGESELARDFTELDWMNLREAALLHARLARGDISVAAELRLRVAKFGMTPEDRLRLRIQFATADEMETRKAPGADRTRPRRSMPGSTGVG